MTLFKRTRVRYRALLIAATLLSGWCAATAAIAKKKAGHWTAPFTCPLDQTGWVAQSFPGRPANRLSCRKGALRIASNASVSLHAISPPAAFERARRLTWDWRVRKSAGASDLSRKGADDRSIAVMVAFRYDPETASLAERLLRPLIEARQGPDAPGRVLAYTWVENKKGSSNRIMKSPFGGAAHRIIPMPRSLGAWRGETIDLAKDHRRAFGKGAFAVQYIALASDTDDLGGMSDAMIRNLRLSR